MYVYEAGHVNVFMKLGLAFVLCINNAWLNPIKPHMKRLAKQQQNLKSLHMSNIIGDSLTCILCFSI